MKIPLSTLQRMNAKTVSELIAWNNNLPHVLQVDVDNVEKQYLPHVLLLQ